MIFLFRESVQNLKRKKTPEFIFHQIKKIVRTIQKAKALVIKRHFRASRKITQLEDKLNKVKHEMSTIGDTKLKNIFESLNISNEQCELIKEIIAAAKVKNPKNQRYSENWMSLCLLFQIRYLEKLSFLDNFFLICKFVS